MMQLRDGTTTQDPRLDRLVFFDERSRQFPIRATLAGVSEPRSYTWACALRLNQGSEGACVGAGVTAELASRPSPVSGLDMAWARGLYHDAQRQDFWEGGSFPGASPFYEGTSVLAGIQVARQRGYCKGFRWAFGLQDLILGVGYRGPSVIGVPWYEGMGDTDSNGYVTPTGRVRGGHCVLLHAVDVKAEEFWGINSWSDRWGIGGRFRLRFQDAGRLLQEQGEAAFLEHRRSKPRPVRAPA